jgi:carboxypeptidase C (cathepsin A)
MTQPTAPTPATDDDKKRIREKVEKLLAENPHTSESTITLGGRAMPYTATAAFVPVVAGGFDEKRGDPEAAVFTIAYQLKDTEARTRPVLFAFNGGPGSASVWLHLGRARPEARHHQRRRHDASPPYTVTDNTQSWFEHFDLVFIDPPHTGYSLSASEDARKKMLSVDGDVAALAEVVRTWLGRHRRWSSPIFIAGESYGTTRGAALTDKLQSLGVAVSGLILVSCAMDLQSIVFTPRNDLPYALFLPGFACAAQYHGKLTGPNGKSAEAARSAAESFIAEEYLAALHAGARLSEAQRRRVAKRVSELTGLSAALVEEKNLRISD